LCCSSFTKNIEDVRWPDALKKAGRVIDLIPTKRSAAEFIQGQDNPGIHQWRKVE
jgi:hypothetical protein